MTGSLRPYHVGSSVDLGAASYRQEQRDEIRNDKHEMKCAQSIQKKQTGPFTHASADRSDGEIAEQKGVAEQQNGMGEVVHDAGEKVRRISMHIA